MSLEVRFLTRGGHTYAFSLRQNYNFFVQCPKRYMKSTFCGPTHGSVVVVVAADAADASDADTLTT